jgi:precorrin-6x reductase
MPLPNEEYIDELAKETITAEEFEAMPKYAKQQMAVLHTFGRYHLQHMESMDVIIKRVQINNFRLMVLETALALGLAYITLNNIFGVQ